MVVECELGFSVCLYSQDVSGLPWVSGLGLNYGGGRLINAHPNIF
jgi:hypothetical protein